MADQGCDAPSAYRGVRWRRSASTLDLCRTLDRQVVAERLRDLRSTLPGQGELLLGLQRVTEATGAVVRVDGAGLTLAHEQGPPRWVAVSDAAMELLEQVHRDLADGPCVAAWAEDRVVAVEDLRAVLPPLGTGSSTSTATAGRKGS